MNKVFLKGRLTKDPEVGNGYVKWSLAINQPTKEDKNNAVFVDCVAFSENRIKFISSYFKRGQEMLAEGSLNISSYKNKEGNTVKSCNVVVNTVEFCGSKTTESSKTMENKQQQYEVDNSGDDDLPF